MYSFSVPTKIVVGAGVLTETASEVKARASSDRVLVVADKGIVGIGLCDKVRAVLSNAGISSEVFADVPPDPPCTVIDDGVAAYKQANASAIVCVGGGSVIDVAKGIALVASLGGTITDYKGAPGLTEPIVPLIAIPTTAGTGSEVTGVLVMIDPAARSKFVVKDSQLMPDVAICDPEVLTTLPASLKATTSMDALTHALEALVSDNCNQFTYAMALEASRLLIAGFSRFISTDNVDVATDMLAGSTMAGIAFTNAGLGAVHAMSHAVGGVLDVPHGEANAILLPHVLKLNLCDKVECKYSEVLALVGKQDQSPEYLADLIFSLNDEAGIARDFKSLNASDEDKEIMIGQIMPNPNMKINPRQLEEEEVRSFLFDLL